MRRDRIDGLDVARALAILGMIAAHIGNDGRRRSEGGWDWLWVAGGRPSALFAVLAGVSISLMLVRSRARLEYASTSAHVNHTRARVAVRGLILIAVGYLLVQLDTPVIIILANLGLMFLLAVPLVGLRARWLALASAAFVGGGWFVVNALNPRGGEAIAPEWPVLENLWSTYYPALAWMGYLLAGMVLGRLAWGAARTVAAIGAAGVLLAVAGYVSGPALGGSPAHPDAASGDVAWVSVAHHTSTPFEMTGNIGVAMATIAVCVALARVARPVMWPLMALGSMAFTAYVAQIIVLAAVGQEMVYYPSNTALIALCSALTAFSCVWRWLLGRGPLERIMTVASSRLADVTVATSPPHESTRKDAPVG